MTEIGKGIPQVGMRFRNVDEAWDPNVQQANDLLSSARLKKKEVSSKNLRRKPTWFEKLRKGRKPTKSAATTKKGAKQEQQKKKSSVQPQVQVENNGNSLQPQVQVQVKENSEKRQEYDAIDSFTELLTTP